MYFIVGKTINQSKQVISYLITNGEGIKEVTPQQVYVEYQNGNLPYLKGFNINNGEVDFKNIDNSLIPTFYNGRGISNSVSILKILEENGKQIGVRILVASGKIMNVSLSDTIKLVKSNKIQLFNAKVVNNKVVMKYAGETAISRGNDEVTINNYDKSKFIIDDNLTLIKYNGDDKEVIIPKGVTSIGWCAFEGCDSLTSVIIPSSVTDIGDEAFEDCTSLTSIRIPNSVTSIGSDAFKRCFMLSSITIPNSVTYIGDSAFYGCDRLTSITIPDSITYITSNAFVGCDSLTSITIPDSVTTIYKNAFSGCTGLTSIIIPDSVMYLNNNAFRGCTALKSITIPDSVTRIGENVFYDCPNLCIKGVQGSEIEKYAMANNIKFEAIKFSKKVSTNNIVRIISPEVENAVVKGFHIRLNCEDYYVSCEDLCKLNARDDIEIEGDCFKKLFTIQKGSYNDKIQYIRRKDVTFRSSGDSIIANNIVDKLDVLRNSKYCIVPYGASCVYNSDWGITLDGWPPEHMFIKDFIKKVSEVSNIDTVIVPKTYVGDLFYFFPKKINFTNRIMFYTLDFDYLSIADDIYERLYDNEQALYCINSVEAWYGDCGSTQFTSKFERSGPIVVFELHDYKGKSKSYSVYWDVDRINIYAFKNSNIETLYLYRDDVVFLRPEETIDEVYAEESFREISCKSLKSIIIRDKPSDETQCIARLMNSGKTKIKYAYDEDSYVRPMLPNTYYEYSE